MGGHKKDPAGFELVAHDELEGKSEAGRAVFQEICDTVRSQGKGKELRHLHVGRVLEGHRRVTRDLLMKVMDIADIPKKKRAILWERYFGGPPDGISQVVRRRIILEGSIRNYGEKVDLSHPAVCWIMKNRATTAEAFYKILTHGEGSAFPWKGEKLMQQWRQEYEAYHMRKFDSNLLAARVETLFEMRPKASRIEWVERGNMPESLKGMSKNNIRILLSALRHGEPIAWESVDRVLFGMDCSLQERVEVAHAWLMAKKNPPPPRAKRERKENIHCVEESKQQSKPKLSEELVPQKTIPYPDELANKSAFAIIRKLVEELKGTDRSGKRIAADVSAALDEVEGVRQPQVTQKRMKQPKVRQKRERKPREKRAVVAPKKGAPLAPPVAVKKKVAHLTTAHPVQQKKEVVKIVCDIVEEVVEADLEPEDLPYEDPETMLFGPQKEVILQDDEGRGREGDLPDFTRYTSVWLLGEFLENFIGRESIGYTMDEEAANVIATEIAKRAPFSINDTANAMKVLAYCYGRFPDLKATALLTEAIAQTVGTDGSVPSGKIMSILAAEPRFSMFLLYYRDNHPESAVTKLFSSLTDLSAIQPHPKFRRFRQTDRDKSYDEVISPPPNPPVQEKKQRRDETFSERHLAKALEKDTPWEDD